MNGLWPDGDELNLLGRVVVALQRIPTAWRAADGADVDDVRVIWLGGDVAALCGARRVTVSPCDRAVARLARHRDAGVVLLGAVDEVRILVVYGDVVRILVVYGDVVDLRSRLVVDARPRLPGVQRHPCAAVVASNHPVGVLWIDPQTVVVAVGTVELLELFAPVHRYPCLLIHHEDGLGIGRMGDDMLVVPRAPAKVRLGGDL